MPTFIVEKVGPIRRADLNLRPLTLVTGDNNTGKTTLSYAIYGFLKWAPISFSMKAGGKYATDLLLKKNLSIDLRVEADRVAESLRRIASEYPATLSAVFSANSSFFTKSGFALLIDSSELLQSVTDTELVLMNPTNEPAIKATTTDLQIKFDMMQASTSEDAPISVVRRFIRDAIWHSMMEKVLRKPFVVTAERLGISLFASELNVRRNILLEAMSGETLTRRKAKQQEVGWEVIEREMSRYSWPVRDNIAFIRDLSQYSKRTSEVAKQYPEITDYLRTVGSLPGKVIPSGSSSLLILDTPVRRRARVPLHIASTSVRSLVELDYFVKHIATSRHILMIDEPELNLHPRHQVLLIRLIARLVNSGVQTLLTTHSDYVLRELNNLVMLGSIPEDKRNDCASKLGYSTMEALSKEMIGCYLAEDGKISECSVDTYGTSSSLIDKSINDLNGRSSFLQEMLFSIES